VTFATISKELLVICNIILYCKNDLKERADCEAVKYNRTPQDKIQLRVFQFDAINKRTNSITSTDSHHATVPIGVRMFQMWRAATAKAGGWVSDLYFASVAFLNRLWTRSKLQPDRKQ